MKTTKFSLALSFFLLFLSCDDTLGCIFPKEPQLENMQFPIGTAGAFYFVELRAEIKNEPRDDDYDYYFEVEGLPLGFENSVNFRTLRIEGRPRVKGTFDVKISVTVDGPFRPVVNEEPEILCNYRTSEVYVLIIE